MTRSLRLAFAGTPEFAVPALAALLRSSHEVVAVYTQPDRPAGRGLQPAASPVKRTALAAELPVLQPETLRSAAAQAELAGLDLDVLIVVAYGLILPGPVLAAPRLGCVNIHASLLPRWRGAAPIQRAIEAGDPITGVSIMLMEAGLDTGPVLAVVETAIGAHETAGSLHDRLADLGAAALVDTLEAWADGLTQPRAQPPEGMTYATKIAKQEARLDFRRPALELDRKVRAFNPWPVAETRLDGRQLRIWSAHPAADPAAATPGTVLAISADGVNVATGSGRLILERVQLAGRRPVDAADFARAVPLLGKVLGA
jgi:methionyl-tRNA formyltransferase